MIPVSKTYIAPDLNLDVDSLGDANGYFTNGQRVAQLEQAAAQHLGVDPGCVAATSSWTTGAQILIEAMLGTASTKVKVFINSFTFAVTALPFLWQPNRKIIPVDCQPLEGGNATGQMSRGDLDLKLRRFVQEGDRVVIVTTDIFGAQDDDDLLEYLQLADQLAKRHTDHKAFHFVDAAPSFGAKIHASSGARINPLVPRVFSLAPTKPITALEGGLVVATKDVIRKVKDLRNYGLDPAGRPKSVLALKGTNARMTEVNAMVGLHNLQHVHEIIAYRFHLASIYTSALNNGFDPRDVTISYYPSDNTNYCYFGIYVDITKYCRDKLHKKLHAKGIGTRPYYSPGLHEHPAVKPALYRGFQDRDVPNTNQLCEGILCLPLHNHMDGGDVQFIINALKEVLPTCC